MTQQTDLTSTDVARKLFAVIGVLSEAAKMAMFPRVALTNASDVRVKCEAIVGRSPEVSAIIDAIFMCACATSAKLIEDKRAAPNSAQVYFMVRDDGLIKIGASNDVQSRLAQLRGVVGANLQLLTVVDGGQKKERSLHSRFAASRREGEWFSPTPELMCYIESLKPRGE